MAETKHFEFINDVLRVYTNDGYIEVTPKYLDGCPGVYIDLVSNKFEDAAFECEDGLGLPLAIIECVEDEELQEIYEIPSRKEHAPYCTYVWGNSLQEDYTHKTVHKIRYKEEE